MSVFKNSNGVWGFKVRINGKQIKRENKDWSKKTAQEMERKFVVEYQEQTKVTLRQVHELRMNDLNLKDSTKVELNTKALRFGDMLDKPIVELKLEDFKKFQKRVSALSDRTCMITQSYFFTLCKYARDNELISSIPFQNVPRVKGVIKNNPRVEYYTLDQYNEFMKVVNNDKDKVMYRILMFCGLRIGELLALQVKHINGDNITIEQNIDFKKSITSPKTRNSYRVVVMDKNTSKMVHEWINGLDGEYFVISRRLWSVSRNYIWAKHKKYMELSGLPYLKIHGFRHSHVSMLINNGFTAHDVAKRIGDTVTMVNEIYGHMYENNQLLIAQKLSEM